MVNIRQVSPELAIKARDELHEVESRIPEDIAALRRWIEKQPHLKARKDDQFILTFLRGTKYSLENAKQKMENYYTIRSFSSELFLNKLIDDRALRLARLGPVIALPKPLKPDGPRIHITRFDQLSNSEFNPVDLFKYQLRIFDIEMQEDDNAVIGGVINIMDMSNLSWSFIKQFEFSIMAKFDVYSNKAMPLQIKAIHVVNMPEVAVTVYNFCKNYMSKEVENKMILHSSFESIYEHVPKEYLPQEYGGTNGCLQDAIDYWEKRLVEHKDYFAEEGQYGTNEELRIGTKVSSESLFGADMDGSFRQLLVD